MDVFINEVTTSNDLEMLYEMIVKTSQDMSCFYDAIPTREGFMDIAKRNNVRLFYVARGGEIVMYFGLEYRTQISADLHMGVMMVVDDILAVVRKALAFCYEQGVVNLIAFIPSNNKKALRLAEYFEFESVRSIDYFYSDGGSVSILTNKREV